MGTAYWRAATVLDALEDIVKSGGLTAEEKRLLAERLRSILSMLGVEPSARQVAAGQQNVTTGVVKEQGQPTGRRTLWSRIMGWIEQQQLQEELPALRSATIEYLPEELLAEYSEAMLGRPLTPVEEARIREVLAKVKGSDHAAFEKVMKLLSAGPPWNMWVVGILDRAANGRATVPMRLANLWAMFIAWQSRDPYYAYVQLEKVDKQLADRFWEAVKKGGELAKQLLELFYELPPPRYWKNYSLVYPEKLEKLRQLLGLAQPQARKLPS